jgi:hypothetical protein
LEEGVGPLGTASRGDRGPPSYRTYWCRCPGLRGRDRGGDSRARARGIILADDGGEQGVESKGVVVLRSSEPSARASTR